MPLNQTELAKFQAELNGLCAKYNVEIFPNITIGIRDIQPVISKKSGEVEEGKITELPK